MSSRSRRTIAVVLVVALLSAAAVVVVAAGHHHRRRHGSVTGPVATTGTEAVGGTISTAPIPNLSKASFGISTGVQLFNESVADIDQDIASIGALPTHWIRTALRWDQVEPKRAGVDDWTKADHIVADARRAGLEVILDVNGTPPWARAPGAGNVEFPPDLRTYAAFCARVAARYRGRVAAYELGNEPNHTKSFATPDPALYAQVLKLSYPLIKAADPQVKVLTGGLGGQQNSGAVVPGDVFLADLYKAGAEPYFDGVSYHPYTYPGLPSADSAKPGWTRMLAARRTMVANGDSAKKMWVTEYGAPSNGPGSVTQDEQAALMYDAYRLWAGYPWAGPLCWFDYRDKGTDTSNHGNFFGLYAKDGRPKVALRQYQSLVRSAS